MSEKAAAGGKDRGARDSSVSTPPPVFIILYTGEVGGTEGDRGGRAPPPFPPTLKLLLQKAETSEWEGSEEGGRPRRRQRGRGG